MQVAQTILAQLGGNKFLAMTGARNLVSDAQRERGALTMKVGRNAHGVTHVRVTLTNADTYRLETLKVRGLDCRPVAQYDHVYADNLRATFEAATGLATSL